MSLWTMTIPTISSSNQINLLSALESNWMSLSLRNKYKRSQRRDHWKTTRLKSVRHPLLKIKIWSYECLSYSRRSSIVTIRLTLRTGTDKISLRQRSTDLHGTSSRYSQEKTNKKSSRSSWRETCGMGARAWCTFVDIRVPARPLHSTRCCRSCEVMDWKVKLMNSSSTCTTLWPSLM